MTGPPRRARVRAFAKLNLGLKVLGRRPDGYHELRTVLQTIDLADTLEFDFTPARSATINLTSVPEIRDNLVARAAGLVLDATRSSGRLAIRLTKRIPMGAGLGGGSSDAAAVLLALPVLIGKRLPAAELLRLAASLGSDVPFFLLGGTVVGLGRGEELYPLPDAAPFHGVLVAPGIHVSTAQAYAALGRELTLLPPPDILSVFQSCAWASGLGTRSRAWPAPVENDFEEAVFRQHPRLRLIKRKLKQMGAEPALLTGSGSALFGVFGSHVQSKGALRLFDEEQVFTIASVSRARYRASWWRNLRAHIDERAWPPQSRYSR